MSCVLLFHERVDGQRTRYSGRYFISYNPNHHWANGEYDGGLLITTADAWAAFQFPSVEAAMETWKQSPTCECHRLRPDGHPNRPLTAYTVSVEPAPAPMEIR